MSAGALYLYFDSKEALIEGIADRERARVLADFAALRDAPDFMSGLEHCIDHCVVARLRDKIALFLEVVTEAMRNPSVRQTLHRVDKAIRDAMREMFAKAQADGRISADVPLDTLTNLLATFVDGMVLRRAIDPTFNDAEIAAIARQTLRAMLDRPPLPVDRTMTTRMEPAA